MTTSQVRRAITAAVLGAALCTGASAQLFGSFGFGANVFDTKGLDKQEIPSQQCVGFYKTPSFKCEGIKVPVYFARVKDGNRRALVVILPGAGGLDKRHGDYANFLAANGINAAVLDPWRARGSAHSSGDATADRLKGNDDINFAIDGMAVQAQLRLTDEWKDAKFGFLGESRGNVDAEDAKANDQAVLSGARVISSYTVVGAVIWIITEAVGEGGRRASSCLLFPEEY